jgi:hypothetical protein
MAEHEKKFETERIRAFRTGTLDAESERTIECIEEFGSQNIHVKGQPANMAFSYTIGVFDTCGGPEVIAVGLRSDTAQWLLNEAVERLRNGVDPTAERQQGLLGADVECEFRPVDRKWVEHTMDWACWFNGGPDFPVIQAVYPDKQNRFPEDDGFDEYFGQPLLQPGRQMTAIEEDFWASNDENSSLFDWKFEDDPHTNAYLSETVNTGTEPISYVSRDADDGAWQFLGDSMSDGGGPVLVCLHHPIDKDPTLKELADLPVGWYAERSEVGAAWIRSKQGKDED